MWVAHKSLTLNFNSFYNICIFTISTILYLSIYIHVINLYFVSVVKRSADLHTEAKFAQFSGKGITEFDIINLEEAKTFESIDIK